MSDTMNAKKELLELIQDEAIIAIELHVDTKKEYMTYEGIKHKYVIPRLFKGRAAVAEALRLLDVDFKVSYNQPSGPNFTVWTQNSIVYCTQYSDGQSGYEKVRRFPPPVGQTEEEYMEEVLWELRERLESLDWYKKKKKKYDWTPEKIGESCKKENILIS